MSLLSAAIHVFVTAIFHFDKSVARPLKCNTNFTCEFELRAFNSLRSVGATAPSVPIVRIPSIK